MRKDKGRERKAMEEIGCLAKVQFAPRSGTLSEHTCGKTKAVKRCDAGSVRGRAPKSRLRSPSLFFVGGCRGGAQRSNSKDSDNRADIRAVVRAISVEWGWGFLEIH